VYIVKVQDGSVTTLRKWLVGRYASGGWSHGNSSVQLSLLWAL